MSVGVRAGVGDEYGHKLEIGTRTIPESFATGSGIILEWVGNTMGWRFSELFLAKKEYKGVYKASENLKKGG